MAAGRTPEEYRRNIALNIRGVGSGSQRCEYNSRLPIVLRTSDGQYASGTFEAPTLQNSNVPGLLGLNTMRHQRAILDCGNLMLHFIGEGEATVNLPENATSHPLVVAPSGHLVLPCGDFEQAAQA